MKKITITQALVEIKILEDRIYKSINDVPTLQTVLVDDEDQLGNLDKEKIEKNFQSYVDKTKQLIKNYRELKSAVSESNATETLTIGEETMTVAEAIVKKNTIQYDIQFVNKIKQQYTLDSERTTKKRQEVLRMQLENIKDDTKLKVNTEIIEPDNIEDIIKQMEDALSDFISSIDVSLNIHNATTTIEVDM